MPELTATEWAELQKRLARIETMLETEAARCPYRETISRATNNVQRLDELENTVLDLRLAMAKAGLLGGATGSAVAAGVYLLAKALGWF